MTEGPVWPPTKEELERLYLVEKLSAARIARLYRTRNKNPKSAESSVLYQLKKSGIARRDPAEHVRKVTGEMVDDWVRRYEAGESLKSIAGGKLSPVTVLLHLRKHGVELRDKVEAQIKAVTKHQKLQFDGDKLERAYLLGLRCGDRHSVKHGRAVRVRVSTTHPAMMELFENLFARYGHVAKYPRKAQLTSYEWNLECDLDPSFGFLLEKPSLGELANFTAPEAVDFLSGFFDAEGSIYAHWKRGAPYPEASISNTDNNLLGFIKKLLYHLDVHSVIAHQLQPKGRIPSAPASEIWKLVVWRLVDVRKVLATLNLRHREKAAKSKLAVRLLKQEISPTEFREQWNQLVIAIREEREELLTQSRRALEERDGCR